jgi:hypothetical protein
LSTKILHIGGCGGCGKFLMPFIRLLKENFDFDQHEFLLSDGLAGKEVKLLTNIHIAEASKISKIRHYVKIFVRMHQADKVIVHGLFNRYLLVLLFLAPWLSRKCYWVIFGGDLYKHQLGKRDLGWRINQVYMGWVISRIGHFVTHIKGDYELAKKWYGANGHWHECFMYPSNLFHELPEQSEPHVGINILLGNSADPSNFHIEALDKLMMYRDRNIHIYAPLSYGNKEHARQVAAYGKKFFGDKFIAIMDFMPFDDYLKLLAQIDLAIFNHKRQQAMGVATTLLGSGRKVYMRSNVTQWEFFKRKGIMLFDIEKIELEKLDYRTSKLNKERVEEYFSLENYLYQLNELFE